MKSGEKLRAWLADTPERTQSAAAVEAFGRAFRRRPAFLRLEAELEAADGKARAALDAARRFLGEGEELEEAVSTMIANARVDPFFRPALRAPASPIHDGLILFDHPSLTLMVAAMSAHALAAKRRSSDLRSAITFSGQHALYHFIRAGGAELSFWETPPIGPGFVGDPRLRCRPTGRRRFRDGESILLDGRRESFVIEHATSTLVYVQALTRLEAGPIAAQYDSKSLTFAGASSTDDPGSRVTMMLSLLRVMDRTDAAPLIPGLLGTLGFHDRWRAMREFLALDAERALPHLEAMAASDPHLEVRTAAAATLAAFFPESTQREDAECPA
ncbi:MAG TPA: hypothetical protein VF652_06555 [Allosphingosinicella sp.]